MKTYIKIDGMHCNNCFNTVKNTLLSIKNIKEVEFDNNIACITYNKKIDKEEIINKIIDKGYITKNEYISNNKEELNNNIKLKEFIIIFITILLITILLYKIFGFNIFNMIPTIDNNLTYPMLFITGILTSIHCISMCGAINLIAVSGFNNNFKRSLLYNLGRIISYTIIGAIAGLIGEVLSFNNIVSGIIMVIASISMFIIALNMLGIIHLKKIFKIKHRFRPRNSFLIGLLNGFMPCGPLQAMQVYALSTGSIIKGLLSMLIFGLGTVPLMLLFGIVINLIKGKTKYLINKISIVLIIFLSIMMFSRGLVSLNINLFSINIDNNYITATKEIDYQVIEFDLDYDNYQDIIVEKDIPVKMIINVSEGKLTGCNNEIIISEYNIKEKLEVGENIIEFTPTKEKTITYTCWMNMITNYIKVVDKID